jgi:hypothetical protein
MMRIWVAVAASAALLLARAPDASAWDAGNDNGVKSCVHDTCSGGVVSASWIETNAAFGKTRLPGNKCQPGTEYYGGFCYKACPANYHRTAVCSCKKNGTGALDITAVSTSCSRYGSTNKLPMKVCGAGQEYWGGLCYDACPASPGITAKRTAPLTCQFTAKWRGNTHLWVVREALQLLKANTADELSQFAWRRMARGACQSSWETGLYEMDDAPYVETSRLGSHFYDGSGKDWNNKPTRVVTYTLPSQNTTAHGNARTNANGYLRQALAKYGSLDMDCRDLGRALHLETDMTMPMHTSTFSAASIPPMLHAYIEFYAAVIQDSYTVVKTGAIWDKRWSGYPADRVLHETSVRSQGYMHGLYAAAKPLRIPTCTYNVRGATPYTDHCWRGDRGIDAQLGPVLRDAYQSTASYVRAAWQPVLDSCKQKYGNAYKTKCG